MKGFEPTTEEKLLLCNLTSTGVSMKDAVERVVSARSSGESKVDGEKTKLSTKERKEILADEIDALGGEVPPMNASIAKFEEALTTAKAAVEGSDADSSKDLM